MILRRLGNKTNISNKILQYAPPHKIYIELFFGAGGMFFNKPKVKYNVLNDLDSEVFNLFTVLKENKDELIEGFMNMPISEDLWNHWKRNKEKDKIQKAVRFLFLSNFGYMGKPQTLRFGANNSKQCFLDKIQKTHDLINDCQFMNVDFRNVIKKIAFKDLKEKKMTWIYSDPPYLNTENNYESSFTEADSFDLFNVLEESDTKFAMSEFDNPFILDQAQKRGLNINYIGERRNLKNTRMEVLITNYSLNSLFNTI